MDTLQKLINALEQGGMTDQDAAVLAARNMRNAYAGITRQLVETPDTTGAAFARQVLALYPQVEAASNLRSAHFLRETTSKEVDENGDNMPRARMRARMHEKYDNPVDRLLYLMATLQDAAATEYATYPDNHLPDRVMYYLGALVADMLPLLLEQLEAMAAEEVGHE